MNATITANANQAAAEIEREKAQIDDKTFKSIRNESIRTFAQMTRTAAYLTGNYRANMRMALNARPNPYRVTGGRAGLPQSLRGYRAGNREMLAQIRPYYKAIEDQHMKEAAALFNGKRLVDIHEILIVNDAAHAHFVERGGPKQKAWWVFARGAELARVNLSGVNIG